MDKPLTIPDSTAEMVMSVIEALSKRSGDVAYIAQYIDVTPTYIKRSINWAYLLGLVELKAEGKNYEITNQFKSISSLYREEPRLIFKNALFQFNPYVLCASLIVQDNSQTESIKKTKAVYNISTDDKILTRVFINASKYIGLDNFSKESLLSHFNHRALNDDLANLIVNRLNNEFEISTLLFEKLGEDCYASIINPERKLITDALLSYKKGPANAIADFAGAFESFLRRLGKDKNISLDSSNGISQIGQVLASKDNKILLSEHRSLCDFISTFRNPASHKVQKDLVEHWNIGSDSALEIILLGISTIRSIFEYVNNKKLLL